MSEDVRAQVELMELKCYDGTGDFWSRPDLAPLLGSGGRIIVHVGIARITGGTSASMTVTLIAEDSSDGENWAQIGSAVVNGQTVNASNLPVTVRGEVEYPHGKYVRFKLNLGGSDPTAWLFARATVKPWEGE